MKNVFGGFGILAIVLFVLAAFFGWGMNVVDIINTVNDPIAGMFILRCVGVFFFPLGAILGWF
jgi:hypothetical protein